MALPDRARSIAEMLGWKSADRSRRRLGDAHIRRFKPLADFD